MGVNPYIRGGKFDLKKLETSLYRTVRSMYFDILNRLGVTHVCDRQTDGQTDRLDSLCCAAKRRMTIDREFITSAKKFANFNEFSEIKKNRKNSYKNSLNARVGVAFQQQLKNLMRFTVSC